jgi:hypothetical protein
MRQHIFFVFEFALLYTGQAAVGWCQGSIPPKSGTLTTPVVQVISAPSGASVQAPTEGLGSLQVGHVSWNPQSSVSGLSHTKDSNSFTITTFVSLRLDCPTAALSKRASIGAYLQQKDPRYVVYFDQIPLSTAPSIISPIASCTSTTQHTLQIKVPTSAASGPIDASIGFQVTLQ